MSIEQMQCRSKADFFAFKRCVICACSNRLFFWLKTHDIYCQFHSTSILEKNHASGLILAESACAGTLTSQNGSCKCFFLVLQNWNSIFKLIFTWNQEIVCSVKVKMCACLKGRIQELAGKGASPLPLSFLLKMFCLKTVWGVMLVLFVHFRCVNNQTCSVYNEL